MPACRGCRRPIRWEKTRTGKSMPLDREPRDDGNVVLRVLSAGAGVIAHVLRADEAEQFRQRRAS